MEPYTKPWSSRHPGLLALLTDQSNSMKKKFGRVVEDLPQQKCDVVAYATNDILQKLIEANTVIPPDGVPKVRARAEVALFGYGHDEVRLLVDPSLATDGIVRLPDLDARPLEIREREIEMVDRASGQPITKRQKYPVWVEPFADGNTPMLKALSHIRKVVEKWSLDHPDSPPAITVNITDGEANDTCYAEDLFEAANALKGTGTNHGQTLLMNVHLSELDANPVEYPASLSELPNDPYAHALFEMSSEVPPAAYPILNNLLNRSLPPHARLLVFNADVTSFLRMIHFASTPAVPIRNMND